MNWLNYYQSDLGEKATEKIFEVFTELKLIKIPKQKGIQTPDYFIVDKTQNRIAVCEVKSCTDTFRLTDHTSKLRRHHAKAKSQLAEYDRILKFIVFVSFDMTDAGDLDFVLDEFKTVFPDEQLSDVYILVKIHQDISPSTKFHIRETIQMRCSSQAGIEFCDKYFEWEIIANKVGLLPLSFTV